MQIITPADKLIEKLIGIQKVDNILYRLSTFVVCDDDLFHNTITGELLRCSNYDKQELIIKGYYVPIEFNEKKTCMQLREIMKMLASKKISKLTILPTTYCNARCFYCYEHGIEKNTMNGKVVENVIRFIRDNYNDEIEINWFGGEPLTAVEQIDAICSGISDIAFSSKMTSNGFLFTKELVLRAKEKWNLKEIQITLDGTEEIYNKTKNYRDISINPFERVLRNIQLLIDEEIKVILRMNVSEENSRDLIDLINQLEVFKGKFFVPYVHSIFEKASEEMDRKCDELQKLLVEKGFRLSGRKLSKLISNHCMADDDTSYIINPNGGIAKCEHFACNRLVGSIEEGIDISKLGIWKQYSIPSICEDCPLLPSCIILDECPSIRPCSPFEKANRIEKTKITMRELARKYDEEHE